MPELIILDNPDAEVAAVVDLDNFRVLPICGVGPNRRTMVESFIDSIPFDVTILPDDAMQDAFVSFLGLVVPDSDAAASEGADDAPITGGRNGDDAKAQRAEAEAHGATDTPGPQPADTDVAASEDTPTVAVKCWNCNGTGEVIFGDDTPARTCGMCNGTGKVDMAAA